MFIKKTLLALIFTFGLFLLLGSWSKVQAATRTWDGEGPNNEWSTPLNWSANTVPVAGDAVVFSGTSTKDSTVDATFSASLATVAINSGYTGTITLAHSLTTTSTFTQSTGTFNSGAFDTSFGSTFTLSGGTFTASSDIATMSGAITISGSPTFNHNSGRVSLAGGSVTLSCNSVSFNLVTFDNTGTKTVNSNCSFPLGANPTVSNAASVSGTLSGSGTLTTTTGTFTLATGASLSGFSSLTANGAFAVNGATANLGSMSSADLNSTFTLTSGSFTAPSGTMTIAGGFTITTGPFNANGGTVTFDGGTATLSCNNATFNLVTLNNTNTKTINSNCTLPLGANPTIANAASVSGTLSGSGTVTTTAGTFTLATTSVLSGFNGFVAGGAFTINGGTVDFGSYSTVDLNSSFTLTSGSFKAPSGTMTLAGSLTLTTGTFNSNGGTLELDGAGATLNCSGDPTTFNSVRITHVSGTKTLNGGCTLPVGNNPTVGQGGSITMGGSLLTGSGTVTLPSPSLLRFQGQTAFSGFDSIHANKIDFNSGTNDLSSFSSITTDAYFQIFGTSTTVIAPPVLTIGTFLQILSGGNTFTGPSTTLTIAGNVDVSSDATFNNSSGTVVLNGSNQTIVNSTTFNNLTKTPAGSDTLTFTAGTTQTITGTLTLRGSSGGNLLLRSSSPGTQWSINPQGSRLVAAVDVQDSNNINSTAISAAASVNSGNNVNWTFSAPLLSNLNLTSPSNGSYTSSTRPTFTWQAATSNTGSSISSYSLSIDNGDSGDFTINNIPSSGTSDVQGNGYVVHFDGFSDSDSTNNYISVYTQSSPSWGLGNNNGLLNEGNRSWTVNAIDSSGLQQSASHSLYVDTTSPSLRLTQVDDEIFSTFPSSGVATTDTTPTIFGEISDPLSGTPGVSSGPQSVSVQIQKKNFLGTYDLFSLATVNINDVTSGSQSKYSTFSYTPTDPLPYGNYQVTLSGKDNAGNSGGTLVFTLTVSSQHQALTPKEDQEINKIIDNNFPNATPKEKSEIKKQLEITQEIKPNEFQKLITFVFTSFRNFVSGTVYFSCNLASSALNIAFNFASSTVSFIANQIGNSYNFIASHVPGFAHDVLIAFGKNVQDRVNQAKQQISWLAFACGEKTQQISDTGGTAIVEFGYLFVSEPTKISQVRVTNVSKTSAKISWKTNHPATGKVNYGLDDTYPLEVQTTKRTTNHEFTLKNLKPDTDYHFEVMSQNRNYVYDANRRFKTPAN